MPLQRRRFVLAYLLARHNIGIELPMTEMMADSTQTEERYQPVAFDPTIHAAKKRKADLPTTHWRTSSLRWGPCSMHARMAMREPFSPGLRYQCL